MEREKNGKSNFSVTCNLLSQFLKEKKGRALSSLGLEMQSHQVQGIFKQPITLNLLPGVDGGVSVQSSTKLNYQNTPKTIDSSLPQTADVDSLAPNAEENNSTGNNRESEKISQLTIFYGGKVLVFDNFPSEKANDLFQIASKDTETKVHGISSKQNARPMQANNSDLPLARTNSLHRFLAKRKDRINARVPYPVKDTTAKPNEAIDCNNQWLGMSPRVLEIDMNS